MNVLIVTDFFVRGGLETHILGYCQTLQDMGHKVSVVVGNEPRVGPLQKIVGDRILQVPISMTMSGLDIQNVTKAIAGFGRRYGCDVVHAHPFMSLIVGTIAAAKMRKPYVTTLHGPACLSNLWGSTYRLFLEGIAFADAFATFCVSKEIIRRVRLLQPNGRYHLLPNGIDVARFTGAFRNDKGPWALIARLDQDKVLGLKHFLSQFSMATECKIPVHIFGEGDARSELENWLSAHLDHAPIIMKGHSDDLDLELRAGYSGVAGMGRVVLEAGALGLPVVLCGYDGIKGLIEPFAMASLQERNLSGRGLTAIDTTELQSQLLGLSQNPQKYNLRAWIVQHANEASVWSDYVKLLSAIPDHVDYEWLSRVNVLLNNLKDSPFLDDDKAANLANVIKRLGRAQENQEGSALLVELEHAEQAIQLLSARLTDNGLAMRALMAQNAEKEQSVQSLSFKVGEKEQAIQILSLEAAQKDLVIQTLSSALADALALTVGYEQRLSQLELRFSEKEQTVQMLSAQVAAKEQTIQSTSLQLAVNEQALRALSSEVGEKEQAIQALSLEVVEKEQVLQTLSSDAAQKEETVKALLSQLAENELTAQSLSVQLKRKEQAVQMSFEALAAKETELAKITNTLGWGWLTRYGRIKYRYLLPVYRALGLPPFDKKTVNDTQRNQLPLDQWAEQGQATSLVPDTGGPAPAFTAQLVQQEQPYISNDSNTHDIVCFPIIDWDFRFQRPQQMMSRFAAAGHRVFYIAQGFYSQGPAYTVQEKRKNVYEISLRGPARHVYTDVLDDKARDELFASLDALRRDLLLGATVAFVQLPFWWPLAEKTRSQLAWPIVYDCMDHHASFSTNNQIMVSKELDLLTSSDLVVVSSAFLQAQARQHNSNVLLVRNACDYEHFAGAGKKKGEQPLIGYYGAIADWFDSDLVADLAERRSDWNFVLVGSTFSADISRLSKLPNVSLPGEKHYSEIPDWLSRFDVVVIPFKRTALTEATNPVKAYEILASGKPLISVPIPEMTALEPLIRLASSAEEFEHEIIAALSEDDSEIVENRRAFAREHTWEKRYDMLAPAVREVFPKTSIIIVTFNNLELNRLCIESLYARTEWPNFEVIVLDNASSDGTPEYLKDAEKIFPNLRVILNDTNLGFARANNIGLQQATGEYLVLLNNDTVVTRGWLSALNRHLRADPQIGLIGPVTNEIGNEAKVSVGYTRLDEMPLWAASYVRENDNRLFPIPMLAMFCVALRREVFEQVGLLDESFEIGMFEDDDYAHRIRENGYDIVCADDCFIHHFGRASFKLLSDQEYLQIFQRNRKIYEEKWGPWEPHKDREAWQRSSEILDDTISRQLR